MKKILVIAITLLTVAFSAGAQTKVFTYDYDNFTGLNISNAFDVTVFQSDKYSIEVEVSEALVPFLNVKSHNGVLAISLDKSSVKLRKLSEKKRVMKATIYMPTLTSVVLSGASTFSSNDPFNSGMSHFVADVTGASRIKALNITSPEATLNASGASSMVMNIKTGELDADISGASRLNLTGKAEEVEIECSGASNGDLLDLQAQEAEIECSGASNVKIAAEKVLAVKLSGASSCSYRGGEGLHMSKVSITGASKIKSLD